jgi:hypothetical protein
LVVHLDEGVFLRIRTAAEAEGKDPETLAREFIVERLRNRVFDPLVEKGILSEVEDGYEVDVKTLQRVFVESGGGELLKEEIEAVEGERARQGRGLKESAAGRDPGVARGNRQTESEKRIDAAFRGELDWNELTREEKVEAFLTP